MDRFDSNEALTSFREELRGQPEKTTIIIGGGTCGEAQGSGLLIATTRKLLGEKGLTDSVKVRAGGCLGFCEIEPIVIVRKYSRPGTLYCRVKEGDVAEIISSSIEGSEVLERLVFTDKEGNRYPKEDEIPFYTQQTRNLLLNNFEINPMDIGSYISNMGYSALQKVLGGMKPEDVVREVKASGIRGRGGAGFPTGMKWDFCRKAAGDQKYVICNADEGDPGAYMDRNVLESNPHSVIEGMVIGGYAMGASKGYVYLRSEYPLALRTVRNAIGQAHEAGLLGKNILGSGFDFELEIYMGAGAFVCGEETALIASIEGRAGEPRQRPPFPAEKGLWGKPTNINNVETWANIAHIINNGAGWYASFGPDNSKGTKIFSLVGKISNVGLVEVPIGTPLRKVIYDIGGGVPNGRRFKAVQSGGPSGGCIPEEHLDTPINYEDLTKLGSIMGSGGLIVMDEDTCMVDVARYFIAFTLDESCGKCTSCREGTSRMLEILQDICSGNGSEESLTILDELSNYIKDTSMCALGGTAPNPVLTTLRYFRDEYLEHINNKACPAKVCKDLITYSIDPEKCTGCTACARKCPVSAITGEVKSPHSLDQGLCTKCGNCHATCKFGAVIIKTGGEV